MAFGAASASIAYIEEYTWEILQCNDAMNSARQY